MGRAKNAVLPLCLPFLLAACGPGRQERIEHTRLNVAGQLATSEDPGAKAMGLAVLADSDPKFKEAADKAMAELAAAAHPEMATGKLNCTVLGPAPGSHPNEQKNVVACVKAKEEPSPKKPPAPEEYRPANGWGA